MNAQPCPNAAPGALLRLRALHDLEETMTTRTGPIVRSVADSGKGLGPYCADCYGPIYVVKVEQGPKIGVRVTYRHVERHPACEAPR